MTESGRRRPGSLRKERREGRIIFLVLVIALAAAVMWLVTDSISKMASELDVAYVAQLARLQLTRGRDRAFSKTTR